MKKELDKTVLSGEYAYDAAYQRADETIAGILDNSYISLDSVANIHLERSYWAQDLLDISSLDNTHYFAASDLQLMSFDGVWCIYFNAEILKDMAKMQAGLILVSGPTGSGKTTTTYAFIDYLKHHLDR